MNENVLKTAFESYYCEEFFAYEERSKELQHNFTDSFKEKMNVLIKTTNSKYISVGKRNISKVLLLAILASLVLAGCVGIKPIREGLVKMFIETTIESSDITFGASDADDAELIPKELPVPDGYRIVGEQFYDGIAYHVQYQNDEDYIIEYKQILPDGLNMSVNTEDVEVYDININGCKGIKFTKYDTNNIIWTDENYVYSLYGNADIEVMEAFARSIE